MNNNNINNNNNFNNNPNNMKFNNFGDLCCGVRIMRAINNNGKAIYGLQINGNTVAVPLKAGQINIYNINGQFVETVDKIPANRIDSNFRNAIKFGNALKFEGICVAINAIAEIQGTNIHIGDNCRKNMA